MQKERFNQWFLKIQKSIWLHRARPKVVEVVVFGGISAGPLGAPGWQGGRRVATLDPKWSENGHFGPKVCVVTIDFPGKWSQNGNTGPKVVPVGSLFP